MWVEIWFMDCVAVGFYFGTVVAVCGLLWWCCWLGVLAVVLGYR